MEALQSRDGPNAFGTSGGGKAEDDDFTIAASDMPSRFALKQKGKVRHGPPKSPFAASKFPPASSAAAAARRQSDQKASENSAAGPSRRPGSSAISGSRQALLSTQATKDRRGGNSKSDGHHSDKNQTLRIKDGPSGRSGLSKSPEDAVSGYASGIFSNPYTNPEARNNSKSRSKSPEKDRNRYVGPGRYHDVLEPVPPASTARNRKVSPYTRPSPSKRAPTPPEEEESIESYGSLDDDVRMIEKPPPKTRARAEAATRRAPSRPISVSPTKHTTGTSSHTPRRRDSHSRDHVPAPSSRRPAKGECAGTSRKTLIPSSNLDLKSTIDGAWAEHKNWGIPRFLDVSTLHVRDGVLVIAPDSESSMTGIPIAFQEIIEALSCRTSWCPSMTLIIELRQSLDRHALSRLISDGMKNDPVLPNELRRFKMHLRLPANDYSHSLLDALYNRMEQMGNIHVDNLLQEQCDHGQKTYNGAKKHQGRQNLHAPPQTRQRNSAASDNEQAGSSSLRTGREDQRPKIAAARSTPSEAKGKGKAKTDSNQSTLQFGPSRLANGSTAGGSEGLRRSARKSNVLSVEDMDDVQAVRAGPSRSPAIPAPADREAVYDHLFRKDLAKSC